MEVLRHNQTLVLSKCASGYTQVRVVGPSGRGDIETARRCATSLKPGGYRSGSWQQRCMPQTGGARRTVHGKTFDLPELAASDLAVPLMFTQPLPLAATNDSSGLDAGPELHSKRPHRKGWPYGSPTARRDFIRFQRRRLQSYPAKGGGKEAAKPYRVRVSDASGKRTQLYTLYSSCSTTPYSWSSAEEAAHWSAPSCSVRAITNSCLAASPCNSNPHNSSGTALCAGLGRRVWRPLQPRERRA